MALQQAIELYKGFEITYKAREFDTARAYINKLKLKLIELPSLPPTFGDSPTKNEELLLARNIFEHAVFLSILRQDDSEIDRSFAQLFSFYEDSKRAHLLEASPQESLLQGLLLLELLVQNRIAEFHSELERLPPKAFEDAGVQLALELERSLVEGAHNRVLRAATAPSSELHERLVARLAGTVRHEIARCCEAAYDKLSLAAAQKLLLLESPAEALKMIEELAWDYEPSTQTVTFKSRTAAQTEAYPAVGVIGNTLLYAKELERIV